MNISRIGRKRGAKLAGAALSFAVAQQVNANWQTLGAAHLETSANNVVELSTTSGARVRLSLIDAETARIRVNPKGAFGRDFSYAIENEPTPVKLLVENDAASHTISLRADGVASLRIVVKTQPDLLVDIYDSDGHLVTADDPARLMAFDPMTGAVEVSKQRTATELYYGFGEKALPISRHQRYMTMWNTDTPAYQPGVDPIYQSIPFFITLVEGKSYGVFFDNTYRTYFDMGATDPQRYTFGAVGGELNYYVFTGGRERSAANIVRDYTKLTGRSALPPLWALGYQQSRYSYTPASQVREVAQTFRDKKIPADVIYLDIGYMEGYRVFTWSTKDFPEPEKLLHDLDAEGFHTVTIVDPGIKVDEQYAIYRDGREHGVYTKSGSGDELQAEVWPGICAFPDFTSPQARAWFGSLYAKFLDQGVTGFWNDMNEPAVFLDRGSLAPKILHDPKKTFPLDARHAGDGEPDSHARYHNVYGMQMARATYEGVHALRPDNRPMVLTRAGYAGIQRYAAVWTGDNDATWDHLAMTIPMLTNLSVSGVPFVGADVGGFVRSPTAELYTRWLQAAALTPFFRTHSAINTDAREPWSFGPDFERINRATIELRYQLLPYLYTLFADQEHSGVPPMRPLWFEYANDTRTYLIEDEFLLGRDLLVAPVLNEGQKRRNVYFPSGGDWIDWFSGARYAGGQEKAIDAPLDTLPLFVRAGATIPVQAIVQNTREMADAPLGVVVALGADGEGSVYQDRGEGYAYRKGESQRSDFSLKGDTLKLVSKGSGFRAIRSVEFLGAGKAAKSVAVDGHSAHAVRFDETTRRIVVSLPEKPAARIELRR